MRRRAPSPRKRVASSRGCGSRPTAFRQFWSVNPAGSGGCLESRPCRLRHVTRAHRAPHFGSVLVARYGSPKPGSRVQLLTGPPIYSGVGCWHPSCALNAAHAGPIPAASSNTRVVGCRHPRWALNPKHAGSTPASCSIEVLTRADCSDQAVMPADPALANLTTGRPKYKNTILLVSRGVTVN